MRGGALPPALLCAALGFLLAYQPMRRVWRSVAALVGGSLIVFLTAVPQNWQELVFLGCWASVLATALALHLPHGLSRAMPVLFGLNAGLWAGAVVAISGTAWDLAIALPWVLVAAPAALVLKTRARLGVKICASWLAAVAILAAAIPLTPTAGYEPDHRQ